MKWIMVSLAAFLLGGFIVITTDEAASDKIEERGMKIESPAFKQGEHIPQKYTCEGADINPPLAFSNIPAEAKSLALIVDDPDAPGGTWNHWAIWNIPPHVSAINEGEVPEGGIQGKNNSGENEFHGPCPPEGMHHYFFKLYALDSMLNLKASSPVSELRAAMDGRIIEEAQLMGLYEKQAD